MPDSGTAVLYTSPNDYLRLVLAERPLQVVLEQPIDDALSLE